MRKSRKGKRYIKMYNQGEQPEPISAQKSAYPVYDVAEYLARKYNIKSIEAEQKKKIDGGECTEIRYILGRN